MKRVSFIPNRDADGIVYAQLQLQTAHRMGFEAVCGVCVR